MSIGQKLVTGFVGIAILVGVVGTITVKHNTQILSDVDQILLSNSNETKAAAGICYHIQSIKSNIKELLFETIGERPERKKNTKRAIGSSISKLQQFNSIWENAIKVGIKLAEEEKKEKELKAFKKFKTKIDGLVLLVNRTIVLQEEEGTEAARLFFEDEVEQSLGQTQKIAKNLEKAAREAITNKTEKIRKTVRNGAWLIIISTFVALFAAIAIRHFIHRTISDPITKLKSAAVEIEKGNLDTEIEITSNDEIGALAQSFNDMARKLKKSYTSLEEKVHERTAELSSAGIKLEEEIVERSSAQMKLQQHIRQLDCFYGISKLIEQTGISLEQIFQETVDLIRNTYQHPDITCVRVTFNGIKYETDNFEKSELSQHAKIKIRGKKTGTVEVYYLGERPEEGQSPFLKEEHDLLDAVAEHLGRIAERRQSGEKLQLFRNLMSQSNDGIFVAESEWGRLLDVNNKACDSLGYTREELLDMTVKDIDDSIADDSSWTERVDQVREKEYMVLESAYKRKDGTTFPVEINVKFIAEERKSYMLAVVRDITERKKAEQRQARLLKQVEGINKELKDFAYIVSHDLKSPLRGIKTLADWTSTDYADRLDEDGKERLNLLSSRVDRMHNLINGVLEYSRVGRVKEEKAHVSLNELVPEVIDMVAAPENVAITVENELPVIECEKTRIMQVFQNLLSNAVKYMDKPQGQIKIGCVEENGFWKFSVADNGPGIEEKHFERIFRIFQTLTPRDEFESTGVGLTVVKKIVELYGGKIWVQSKLGQGSTFFFTLPKQKIGVKDARLKADIAC